MLDKVYIIKFIHYQWSKSSNSGGRLYFSFISIVYYRICYLCSTTGSFLNGWICSFIVKWGKYLNYQNYIYCVINLLSHNYLSHWWSIDQCHRIVSILWLHTHVLLRSLNNYKCLLHKFFKLIDSRITTLLL